MAGRLIFEPSSGHLRAFPYFAPAGAWGVWEPAHVCQCGRGPWGGCGRAAGAVGLWRKGGRVLAGKRFCLHGSSPAGSAVKEKGQPSLPFLVEDLRDERECAKHVNNYKSEHKQ